MELFRLRDAFRVHLFSSKGEHGIELLADRAQNWLVPLAAAWACRKEAHGPAKLANVLTAAINALDRADLRSRPVRLRSWGNHVPTAVICKFTRAFVEYLAANDNPTEREALETIQSGHDIYGVGFREALAEFYIDKSSQHLDQAEQLLISNLALAKHPYSEYLLYRILDGKGKSEDFLKPTTISINDLSNRFCPHPFTTIGTLPPAGANRENAATPGIFACYCPGMLPYHLNDDSESTDGASHDFWNGAAAREIRRSIHDGEFTYCSRMLCSDIVADRLPKRNEIKDPKLRDIIANRRMTIDDYPSEVMLAHDVSCNLACPSCRTEILVEKRRAQDAFDQYIDQTIMPLMENTKVRLHLSGDGDPIASKHYRRLLQKLDPSRHAAVDVALHSNGILFTHAEWLKLAHVHSMINSVGISIDAAEKATYEDLRRPGKWDVIIQNMEFIANLRRTGEISFLSIQFVVQKKNFEQMPAFVELGRRWSVDRIYFSRLFPTIHATTAQPDEYRNNDVCEADHPDHERFLEVLENPILRADIVDFLNLAHFMQAKQPAPEVSAKFCDEETSGIILPAYPEPKFKIMNFRYILFKFKAARKTLKTRLRALLFFEKGHRTGGP